jgi:hypothetical protein
MFPFNSGEATLAHMNSTDHRSSMGALNRFAHIQPCPAHPADPRCRSRNYLFYQSKLPVRVPCRLSLIVEEATGCGIAHPLTGIFLPAPYRPIDIRWIKLHRKQLAPGRPPVMCKSLKECQSALDRTSVEFEILTSVLARGDLRGFSIDELHRLTSTLWWSCHTGNEADGSRR